MIFIIHFRFSIGKDIDDNVVGEAFLIQTVLSISLLIDSIRFINNSHKFFYTLIHPLRLSSRIRVFSYIKEKNYIHQPTRIECKLTYYFILSHVWEQN